MTRTLGNVVGYELVWLAAIEGASRGHAGWGPLALLPFAGWYLSRAGGRVDGQLMAWAAVGGLLLDSLLTAMGLVAYATPLPFAWAAPVWIVAMWAAFALTLRHSLGFLRGRPLLAAALGAIGAPLAYLAAARGWHAVAFPLGTVPALAALALGWAGAMPALASLAVRLDRGHTRGEIVHGY